MSDIRDGDVYASAIHESSHLVVARALGMTSVGIVLSHTLGSNSAVLVNYNGGTGKDLRHEMIVACAGSIGTRMIVPQYWKNEMDAHDRRDLVQTGRKLHGIKARKSTVGNEILKAELRAREIVIRHRGDIVALTDTLMDLWDLVKAVPVDKAAPDCQERKTPDDPV